MAKGKKGKKGGKKKKKEEAPKDVMTEVDREIFQLTIADLTNKYERIKARCLELEAQNEELEKSFEKLDEDRADIISYLNRTVQQKMEEIAELQERLEGLRQAKEAEAAQFRERIATLENEYKCMHEQLTSEIKLLTGKLNSLEEFRLQREELMKKFKDQEQQMVDQEERHKRQIYDIERKFVIGKDKLKREMEARLVQLSHDFQKTTTLRVAATTHRTIRENIALNNELDLMLKTAQELTAQNQQVKKIDTKLKQTLELYHSEKNMVINKNRIQNKIIEKLAFEHDEMEEMIGGLTEKANRASHIETKYKCTVNDVSTLKQYISSLQQKLDACQYEQTVLRDQTSDAEQETIRLQRILRQTITSVKDALHVQRTPSLDDEYKLSKRESLLNNMLTILNMAHIPEEIPPEPESEMYMQGDLGLIAKSSSILSVESGKDSYSNTQLGEELEVVSEKSGSRSARSSDRSKSGSSRSSHSERSEPAGSAGSRHSAAAASTGSKHSKHSGDLAKDQEEKAEADDDGAKEEPESQPEEPASQPEEPASQPEEPASQPEEPASQPEEPASKQDETPEDE